MNSNLRERNFRIPRSLLRIASRAGLTRPKALWPRRNSGQARGGVFSFQRRNANCCFSQDYAISAEARAKEGRQLTLISLNNRTTLGQKYLTMLLQFSISNIPINPL